MLDELEWTPWTTSADGRFRVREGSRPFYDRWPKVDGQSPYGSYDDAEGRRQEVVRVQVDRPGVPGYLEFDWDRDGYFIGGLTPEVTADALRALWVGRTLLWELVDRAGRPEGAAPEAQEILDRAEAVWLESHRKNELMPLAWLATATDRDPKTLNRWQGQGIKLRQVKLRRR